MAGAGESPAISEIVSSAARNQVQMRTGNRHGRNMIRRRGELVAALGVTLRTISEQRCPGLAIGRSVRVLHRPTGDFFGSVYKCGEWVFVWAVRPKTSGVTGIGFVFFESSRM